MEHSVVVLSSPEETIELGKSLAAYLKPGSVLALSGDLGAGKTTFVQGIALGLGIQDPIQSPTYVFLNQYSGRLSLYHFDLYRLKDESDFLGLGFDEYFALGGVCIIEWPERIASLLPKEAWCISFAYENQARKVSF
jgi:tRNA threonylcarbamoyladenosine biosynthesis protein TsaE